MLILTRSTRLPWPGPSRDTRRTALTSIHVQTTARHNQIYAHHTCMHGSLVAMRLTRRCEPNPYGPSSSRHACLPACRIRQHRIDTDSGWPAAIATRICRAVSSIMHRTALKQAPPPSRLQLRISQTGLGACSLRTSSSASRTCAVTDTCTCLAMYCAYKYSLAAG